MVQWEALVISAVTLQRITQCPLTSGKRFLLGTKRSIESSRYLSSIPDPQGELDIHNRNPQLKTPRRFWAKERFFGLRKGSFKRTSELFEYLTGSRSRTANASDTGTGKVHHIPSSASIPNEIRASILFAIKKQRNVFIEGPAWSGKSATLEYIVREFLWSSGLRYAVTSVTHLGVPRIGGTTVERWLGIPSTAPYSLSYVKNCLYKNNSNALWFRRFRGRWKSLQACEVLIIDDVTLLSPEYFFNMNALLKTVRGSNEFMGGIQVIACGELNQVPRVGLSLSKTCSMCGLKRNDMSRSYLPPNDPEVLRRHSRPYRDNVGVSREDWIECNNRSCNHLWNPTVKHTYQSLMWHEANFTTISLVPKSDIEWDELLMRFERGIAFWGRKAESVLCDLMPRLPNLHSGIKPTKLYVNRETVDNVNEESYNRLRGLQSDWMKEVLFTAVDSKTLQPMGGPSKHGEGVMEMEPEVLSGNVVYPPSILKIVISCQVLLISAIPSHTPGISIPPGSRGIVTGFRVYPPSELHEKYCVQDNVISAIFNQKGHTWETTTSNRRSKESDKLDEESHEESDEELDEVPNEPLVKMPIVTFISPPGVLSHYFEDVPVFPQEFKRKGDFSLPETNITNRTDTHENTEARAIHSRIQLPLKWGWATTLKETEGMKLDYMIIKIEDELKPGQCLEALKRVRATGKRGVQIAGTYASWQEILGPGRKFGPSLKSTLRQLRAKKLKVSLC